MRDDARYYVHLESGHTLTGWSIHHRFKQDSWRFLDGTQEGAHLVQTEDGEERLYRPEERVALSIEMV